MYLCKVSISFRLRCMLHIHTINLWYYCKPKLLIHTKPVLSNCIHVSHQQFVHQTCVLTYPPHTGAKIRNLSKNLNILKISFLKNSHFKNYIFFLYKIHNFKVSFFTKFTFFEHQILRKWIKSCFLSQCALKRRR